MRVCLDASVAVASQRSNEPTHAASRARVDRVLAGIDDLVVPALFQVEVASALTRAGVEAKVVLAFTTALLASAQVVTIGPRRASLIAGVAMRTKLRAADAAYAWVTESAAASLVTADDELLSRGAAVCAVERP